MLVACAPIDRPQMDTIYREMARSVSFANRIARAREAQQHAMVDQTVTMADAATATNWQVVRLRIWARQWAAARLAPKVYGEKTDVSVSGEIVHLTEDQRHARILQLEAKRLAAGLAIEGTLADPETPDPPVADPAHKP